MMVKGLNFILAIALLSLSHVVFLAQISRAQEEPVDATEDYLGVDPCQGLRSPQGTCLIRQSGPLDFVCNQDQNGVPTVFVHTQGQRIPIISWAFTQQNPRNTRARCRDTAIRLRNFYNCKVLDTIDVDASSVFVRAKPGICPELKPDPQNRLLVIKLEPGMNPSRIKDQLLNIRAGLVDDQPLCIRQPGTTPPQPSDPQPEACKPLPPASRPLPPAPVPVVRPIPSPIPDLGPITSVSQLSDVQPTDWAFRAVQSLVDRYGCIVGYPDRTFRGNQAITRYEFAAGLNACLDRMNELIAAATADRVQKEDVLALRRLQEEFAVELATLRGRVDAVETRVATLEKQQFSVTTKLHGEAIFAISDEFNQSNNVAVFQNRVRLNLETSFTGRDILHTRLTAGNAVPFDTPGGTAEGSLQFRIGGDTGGNRVRVDRLSYLFPVGEKLWGYIAANGGIHSDYTPSTNPYLDDFDGGSGALSVFGQTSPIYRIGGGAGVALYYEPSRWLSFSAGYLAGPGVANPAPKHGLVDGNYAALGQITLTPKDWLKVSLIYVHGYHRGNTPIFNQGDLDNQFFTGTTFANTYHFGQPATTDSFGLQASLRISRKFTVSGFFGYTDITRLDRNFQNSQDIWYYGLTLAFPDLGKEGNLGGLVIGVEPYLGSSEVSIPNDTSFHVEGFYRYQLTDSISITPGVIWITAPNQDASNDAILIGTVRLTFRF